MTKPFYFPLYTADFTEGTVLMSCEEVGAYVRLLVYQFNKGSIPKGDPEMIKRITGSSADLVYVLSKFPKGKNQRMTEVVQKMTERSVLASRAATLKQAQNRAERVRTQCGKGAEGVLSKAKAKSKAKDKENILKDSACAETAQSEAKVKVIPKHVEVMEAWAAIYVDRIGAPFKASEADYTNMARLVKRFGKDAVIAKSLRLLDLCENRACWFTRGGMADFTVGKLSSQWNGIIPGVDQRGVDNHGRTIGVSEADQRAIIEAVERERSGNNGDSGAGHSPGIAG